jgi:TPR repeat protein
MCIKTIILVAILASASLLASCANHLQLGVDAYNRGEYDEAAQHLDGLAKSGDRSAQYHVGLLREGGLGSTPKNSAEAAQWYLRSAKQGYVPAMVRLANIQMAADYEEQALSWYVLAARWGNDDAITALTNLGRNVPSPDLLLEQQRYEDAFAAQPAGGPRETQLDVCFSDSSCDVGFSCAKGRNRSTGVCRRSVAGYGARMFGNASIDSIDSIKPNTDLDGKCQLNTDCPKGFLCDGTHKFCVAR